MVDQNNLMFMRHFVDHLSGSALDSYIHIFFRPGAMNSSHSNYDDNTSGDNKNDTPKSIDFQKIWTFSHEKAIELNKT